MRRIGGGLLLAVALVACTGEDETADTLDSLAGGSPLAVTDSAPASTEAGDAAATPSATAGATGRGWVRIELRVAETGEREALLLDRATVAAEELDPISLFAGCTGLDGGPGYVVEVTDLRRLTTGASFVSARLTIEGDVALPGLYEATLDLSDAAQAATSYRGTAVVERGLRSGTFDVVDDQGHAVTGRFRCADAPVVESTTTLRRATVPPGTEESGTAPPSTPPLTVPVTPPSTLPVTVTVP